MFFSFFILSCLLLIPPIGSLSVKEPQEQCPCLKVSGSDNCISYDSRLMAVSIDEAMFSFPNLVTNSGSPMFDESDQTVAEEDEMSFGTLSVMKTTVVSGTNIEIATTSSKSNSGPCVTSECMQCKLEIVNGFLQNSDASDPSLQQAKENLQEKIGQSSISCSKMQKQGNQRERKSTLKYRSYQNNKKIVEDMAALLRNTTTRNKRNSEEKDKLLGVTSQLGCDYRKGTTLTDTEDWCGLCNLCWQWRRLPDDYFPAYINEVSCDSKDNGCLAGFGQCRPVIRVLNILKNMGTKHEPKWEQVVIESAAACECQVQVGTPIHALASKK